MSSSSGFEQFLDNIGSKALQVIFTLSILLTIIVGSLIASGTEEEYISSFVDNLSSVLNIGWVYSGMMKLATAAKTAYEGFSSYNLISMVSGIIVGAIGFAEVIASILGIVVSGYISVAIFIIDSLPGIVKPIGVFIAMGLVFVQMCCIWVLSKYMFNIVKSVIESITGRASSVF